MRKLVIIPGGFHPFHSGHKALYDAARVAFPSADVFVAATADTSTRPFPFRTKKMLAQAAGIPANRFIEVKSPFKAEEITQVYDPDTTQLIFARSEKDKDNQPLPGGVKKDGSPSYLQPYRRNGLLPMSQHGYIAYLPVVQFGPGMTSATEIRAKWPTMTPDQKIGLIKVLYPSTAENEKAAAKLVEILDSVLSPAVKETVENKDVDEAIMVNDPERGVEIRPDGGMGTWNEATLVSALARDLTGILELIKAKNYKGAYIKSYDKFSPMKSRLKALAQLDQFMDSRGRKPLAKGQEYDLSQYSDYVDESR